MMPGKGGDRFKLVLTDGVGTASAIIATQLNEKIQSGELREFSVIRIKEYTKNAMQQAGMK
jgi:replication factor A1